MNMTKDELINRVLLLSSHLQMALKEGEEGVITISGVDTDIVMEIAKEWGCVLYEPTYGTPYYSILYSKNRGQIISIKSRAYKLKYI
jgi:hypothetical protein